jgi:hypothetical protein
LVRRLLTVDFRQYDRIVGGKPTSERNLFSYDISIRLFPASLRPDPGLPMQVEETKTRWFESSTRAAFESVLGELALCSASLCKVTKIVCFGLGELASGRERTAMTPSELVEDNSSLVQHWVALTLAHFIGSLAKQGAPMVRLLGQDPAYLQDSISILQKLGFEIVGRHGAAGFAEMDDECIVFTCSPDVPVKQIIAELARPVIIICNSPSINPAGKNILGCVQRLAKVLRTAPGYLCLLTTASNQ